VLSKVGYGRPQKNFRLDCERACYVKGIHRTKRMGFQQRNNRGRNGRCDLADVDICQIRHRVTLQLSVIRFSELRFPYQAGMPRLLEQRDQQCMLRSLERIEHGHASPGKSVLEILAEEQAAFLIGGHGKDQRVPDRRLLVRREIKRRAQCVEGGVGDIECIGPTQNGGSRCCRRIARAIRGRGRIEFV